jgi:hypothetical protein
MRPSLYAQGGNEHVCKETDKPYVPKNGDIGDSGDSNALKLFRTSGNHNGLPSVEAMKYDRENSSVL